MGLDKSQPVVVRNNTTWRIHDSIKARTSRYNVKSGRDGVKTKDTNSNQGDLNIRTRWISAALRAGIAARAPTKKLTSVVTNKCAEGKAEEGI
jgi:hypothetical protein